MNVSGHSVRIWLPACLAFALLSCSVETATSEGTPPDADKVQLSLEAFTDGGAGKTVLDFPSVRWEDSDEIAVFDGVSKNIFSIPAGGNSGTSARFEGEVSQGASMLYAAYPASAAEACENGLITISVPRVQQLSGSAVSGSGALPIVAQAQGSTLQFRNITALMKVGITSSDITAVLIQAPGISGTVKVHPDGTLESKTDPCGEVLLLPAGDCFAPGEYYAALLPGTLAAGDLSLSLIRSDALSCTRTISKAAELKRNHAVDAGSPEQGANWESVIYTKDQLFAWNASRSVSDDSAQVSLGADIDMEMDPWTPRDFTGSFDGRGHRLSGLNVVTNEYAGFFRHVAGTASVRDLVVGSADGVNYDGVSVIRHAASANNYTWYYVGVVPKASNTSSVSGVVNFATVEVAADATSKTRVGGIVGNWNSSGTLSGCTNYGTVRNLSSVTGQASESDATSNSSLMGGVLGFFDVVSTVEDCANYGDVYSVNPWVSAVGGVAGYDARGATLSGCSNHGKVEQRSTSISADTAVGGVIAYAKGASSSAFGNLTDCSNEGPVSACGNGKIMRIGGVSGYTGYYLVTDCRNSGDVSFSNASASGGYIAIGGVCAHTYNGSVVTSCSNSGRISSNKPQVNRIAGVVGNNNSSTIRDCTNEGAIALDNSASSIALWQGVGGITGFSEGTSATRDISDCTNTGDVSAIVCTSTNAGYERVGVGDIIGMAYTTAAISGNVNRGAVSVQNKHASEPWAYVGGIMGQDHGASSASAFMSNANYGSVRCISGRDGYSGAGGLFGRLTMASTVSGNCSYGDVSGTVAGAIAGVNACTFTASACDAMTVNSVNHGAASDKAVWACPQSTGTISLIVTPHSDSETGGLPKPLDPGNKVVAHRGGATESGYPDNSRAGLRYAMRLGCYACECDIYWTKDDKVIVAHADANDYVNGMHPWEYTAQEIIDAKSLKNYEKIPLLEEYIDIVMESGSRTKLLLDIKMIDTPSLDYDHPAKAALKAIEIVQQKGAQNFVEFICTSYENVMKQVAGPMKEAGLACGWMNGNISAATFKNKGYTDWANLNTRDHFNLGSGDDKGSGNRTIQEFKNAGLQLSVFHIDKKSGNSSAVYTDETVQLYLDEYSYLKCITTNYPSWLINKTKGL
ncbi:MAG: hypothetical protein J6W82_10455 [Bacteroidales bacterium]|nr:hypothetical protein [Bacteroidales bacterium]